MTTSMSPSVVSIGECMLELAPLPDGQCRLGHAGDTYNTALYLARLGLSVGYLTALGTDPFSTDMRAAWAAEGLDTSLVLSDPDRLPGLYAILTDRLGERSFHYWREGSAARRMLELPGIEAALETARHARLVYISGITLSLFDASGRARLAEVCATVRARGGQVAFDPNYRPRGWRNAGSARAAIEAFAPVVSIAMPTFDDEAALFGDAAPAATLQRWQRAGAHEVVIKLGANGCRLWAGSVDTQVPPAAHVMARDTTGAGDAFNAGYIAARWYGAGGAAAAAFANRLAGEVVKHPGAIIPRDRMPPLPIPAETAGDLA